MNLNKWGDAEFDFDDRCAECGEAFGDHSIDRNQCFKDPDAPTNEREFTGSFFVSIANIISSKEKQ